MKKKIKPMSINDLRVWLGLKIIEIRTPDQMFNFICDPQKNNYNCQIQSDKTPWYNYPFAHILLNNRMFWEHYKKMEDWQKRILRRVFGELSWWRED